MLDYRILLFLFVFLPVAACGNDSNVTEDQSGASSEDVKRETAEAYEAIEAYAKNKKEEFVIQAEATLNSYEERIDEIKAKTKDASGEAKKKLEKAMQEWEARKRTLREKIEEMKTASAERWQELEKQVDAAMEKLRQLYDQARSTFS